MIQTKSQKAPPGCSNFVYIFRTLLMERLECFGAATRFKRITREKHARLIPQISDIYLRARHDELNYDRSREERFASLRLNHWFANSKDHEVVGAFSRRKLIGFGVIARWSNSDYQHHADTEKVNAALRLKGLEPADVCVIEAVSILPARQGKGDGSRLRDELLRRAAAEGKNYRAALVSMTQDSKGHRIFKTNWEFLTTADVGILKKGAPQDFFVFHLEKDTR